MQVREWLKAQLSTLFNPTNPAREVRWLLARVYAPIENEFVLVSGVATQMFTYMSWMAMMVA
jgi:hypothetical protein